MHLTPDEERLIETLRLAIHVGMCDENIFRRLRDYMMADDESPVGKWIIERGLRQPFARETP